uniref:Uncharacterized protein n=1 Tax=Glossina austeni TaxID=7395 RepID=A0A1A9UPY8_GLOAU
MSGDKRNTRASSLNASKGDNFIQGSGVPSVPRYLTLMVHKRTEQSLLPLQKVQHQGSQTITKLSRPQATTLRNNLLYSATETAAVCVLPSVNSTFTHGLHLIVTTLHVTTW